MLEKLKQLSKETALYGLSTVLGRFINFILVPFYSNVLDTGDMGLISNIYAYIGILNIIFNYGMDSAYLKMGSLEEYKGKKDPFSNSYVAMMASSFLLVILLFLLKGKFAAVLGSTPENAATISRALNYSFIVMALDALTVVPFIHLRLQNKAVQFSLIRIGSVLINIALNLGLILGFKMGIDAVLIANVAASGFSLVALLPTIVKNVTLKVDFAFLKRTLKFGLPFLPGGFAAMLIQVVDKPIVEKLAGYKTLGIYHANYKMGVFMMLFVSMFQYAWQPFFLKNAKEKDSKEVLSKVFTYFALLGTIVVVTVSLFIDDAVRISIFGKYILGKAYWDGTVIIPIVLAGYLFYGFYIIFNSGFYIKENSLLIPAIMGGGALINVALNYLLIPYFGITGAASATLFAYMFVAYAAFGASQKIYRVNYEKGNIAKIAAILVVMGIAYYALFYLKLASLGAKLVLFVLFVDMIIFSGILTKKQLRMIFKID